MQKEELMKKVYYDVKNPASFGTAQALVEGVNSNKTDIINLNEARAWLETQIPATLHKPKRKRFARNKVVVNEVNEQWQIDLVDMQTHARHNSGQRYIVTIIDVLSKFSWAFPIKNKTPENIIEGFQKIFESTIPLSIQSDQGLEFDNRKFKTFLSKYNVRYFTTRNTEIKCSLVERFNRTLRNRMFKYFTSKGTRKYIDILPSLLEAYNGRVHGVTGMKPKDVKAEHSKILFKKLYGFQSEREMLKASKGKPILGEGDTVRISYQSKDFEKGYYPNWTDETFKVAEAIKGTSKAQYKLEDHTGEKIEGRFYPEEVQKIESDLYRIKVLKYRTRNGVREAFVNWVNYPESINSWIPESQITDI